jgi:hypothetical protein
VVFFDHGPGPICCRSPEARLARNRSRILAAFVKEKTLRLELLAFSATILSPANDIVNALIRQTVRDSA